jgi:hypothetical protein
LKFNTCGGCFHTLPDIPPPMELLTVVRNFSASLTILFTPAVKSDVSAVMIVVRVDRSAIVYSIR